MILIIFRENLSSVIKEVLQNIWKGFYDMKYIDDIVSSFLPVICYQEIFEGIIWDAVLYLFNIFEEK